MDESASRPLKVFLCHDPSDESAVRDVYNHLIANGVDVWMELLPGQDTHLEISRAVQRADVVVVCLSKKSVTKEGIIQKQINLALNVAEEKAEGTIFLIPARLEYCAIPDRLSRWQKVDLHKENGFDKLLSSLKSRAGMLGKEDDIDGEPPSPPIPPKPGGQTTDRRGCYIYIIFSLIVLGIVGLYRPEIKAFLQHPVTTTIPSSTSITPTLTPTPTSTPSPTNTPEPTVTPTPTINPNLYPVFQTGSLTSGYDMGVNSSGGRTDWVTVSGEEMCMAYPSGQAWGAVFITVGKPKDPPRPSQDLSEYKKLSIELRGDKGNEIVLIGVKDNTQPDDGSETKIRVANLTTGWTTVEISLTEFTGADFSRLYVVAEFVFENIAETVCVRNIQFLQ